MEEISQALQEQLSTLNPPQRAAVTNIEGPMLVIAGAGSGKTRVLTYRIAYLLSKGVKPYNILALTFTKKAAQEMKERIAKIVGDNVARQLWMGTFHSIFAKILRMEAESLGLSSSFTIYDTADSQSLIKSIVKEMKLDDKVYKPSQVLSAISAAKNDLVTPQAYANDANFAARDRASQRTQTGAIYARYAAECRKANALDFDDLLLYTNRLFKDNEEVLHKYQDKFRFLLVDEYQDTNRSQYIIIRRLVERHRNICVVGDDAQSIYSFRGARIENILSFSQDYPDYHLYKLEQNYRSTQNIVDAANSLISQNTNQIHKTIFSAGDEGEKIHILAMHSDIDEAAYIGKEIASRIRYEHLSPSDFAVLYRANVQSRNVEEQLRLAGIPCRIYGGQAFYQRKEVKDVIAYFRLAVNQTDMESLRRVINYPARGIGDTTQEKIFRYASENNISAWDAMTLEHLTAIGLNNGTIKKVLGFRSIIEDLIATAAEVPANMFAKEAIRKSGIINDLNAQKDDRDGKERLDNVNELINAVEMFAQQQEEEGEPADINTYLTDVALVSDVENDKNERNSVSLMTIHSSKGLEFPYVFIIGVEEEIFPSSQSSQNPVQLEEERRLFYVAITRAMKAVTITYTTSRFMYGNRTSARPSRFISDIDDKYCDKRTQSEPSYNVSRSSENTWQNRYQQGSYGQRSSYGNNYNNNRHESSRPIIVPKQMKRVIPTPNASAPTMNVNSDGIEYGNQKIYVGSRVMHDTFGVGEVKGIDGVGASTKLTIEFRNVGTKHLLLKFARLKVVE